MEMPLFNLFAYSLIASNVLFNLKSPQARTRNASGGIL